MSIPGSIDNAALEEAAVKTANVKGESKAGKAPSKKPKEGKGKIKSSLKVEGGFVDQTTRNLIQSGALSESSTLQEDSSISEVKREVSEKNQQKSGKLLAKFLTAKQPMKKAPVPKTAKARDKSGNYSNKVLNKTKSEVLGENPSESLQLLKPCSASRLCHCVKYDGTHV